MFHSSYYSLFSCLYFVYFFYLSFLPLSLPLTTFNSSLFLMSIPLFIIHSPLFILCLYFLAFRPYLSFPLSTHLTPISLSNFLSLFLFHSLLLSVHPIFIVYSPFASSPILSLIFSLFPLSLSVSLPFSHYSPLPLSILLYLSHSVSILPSAYLFIRSLFCLSPRLSYSHFLSSSWFMFYFRPVSQVPFLSVPPLLLPFSSCFFPSLLLSVYSFLYFFLSRFYFLSFCPYESFLCLGFCIPLSISLTLSILPSCDLLLLSFSHSYFSLASWSNFYSLTLCFSLSHLSCLSLSLINDQQIDVLHYSCSVLHSHA